MNSYHHRTEPKSTSAERPCMNKRSKETHESPALQYRVPSRCNHQQHRTADESGKEDGPEYRRVAHQPKATAYTAPSFWSRSRVAVLSVAFKCSSIAGWRIESPIGSNAAFPSVNRWRKRSAPSPRQIRADAHESRPRQANSFVFCIHIAFFRLSRFGVLVDFVHDASSFNQNHRQTDNDGRRRWA